MDTYMSTIDKTPEMCLGFGWAERAKLKTLPPRTKTLGAKPETLAAKVKTLTWETPAGDCQAKKNPPSCPGGFCLPVGG
jgi:hypothetical protein